LELSGPGSKTLVAQDMVDQPLSKEWHYINLVGRRLRTYPHNSLSLSISTTKARTASCLALKTSHGLIMVRPTSSPKRDASIAMSLEKAVFGPKTQRHVQISVCRRQFNPKPGTRMLCHYESPLTYIKSGVWLLFLYLSTAAVLLPKHPDFPKMLFSKTSLRKTHVCCCSSSLRHYQSKCCVVLRRGVSLQFGCVTDKGNIMYRTNVERTAATFNISASRHGSSLLLFYTTNCNIYYQKTFPNM
jgi:hypothetical protein